MEQKMSKDLTSKDVADFFLSKQPLSQKKVQKLVYYAYAWYITLYNENSEQISQTLFDEEPEAWMHGPVFPSLYQEYKEYGWRDIPKKSLFQKARIPDTGIKAFLDDVWKAYGKYSADQLEMMTHQEMPWQNARGGVGSTSSSKVKISKKDIFLYYNSLR